MEQAMFRLTPDALVNNRQARLFEIRGSARRLWLEHTKADGLHQRGDPNSI